jgi:transposase InsO family protein
VTLSRGVGAADREGSSTKLPGRIRAEPYNGGSDMSVPMPCAQKLPVIVRSRDSRWSPAGDLVRQQKRFDVFRLEFNTERPHEAIGMKRPAELYRASPRPYPSVLPPIEYSGRH